MRCKKRWSWGGMLLLTMVAADVLAQNDKGADAGTKEAQATPTSSSLSAETDTDFKEAVVGKDVTATFRAKYKQDLHTLFDARRKLRLPGYRVILVPGFITALYLQISQIAKDTFKKDDFLDYLSDLNEAVKQLGFGDANELLDKTKFNTGATVAVNAERIARSIKDAAAAGKKVILISHSKGGNDTLAALLLLQKAGALKNVRGWVSIQSGFLGSPVADEGMNSATLREIAKLYLEQTGGTLDSLRDSGTGACKKFMTDHDQEVQKLAKALPILSFASWKPKPPNAQLLHPDTILFKTRDLMAGQGLKNDGLVPTKGAVLPGTEYIAAVGIDHAEPAMKEPSPVLPSGLDRKQFAWALLSMLFDQIEHKAGGSRSPQGPSRGSKVHSRPR